MNKKNSGFSLVELIVVIAIMAVLVGVLAPAYLKYVEKSRKSTDVDALSEILEAAKTIAADTEYEDLTEEGTQFIVTVDSKKVTLSTGSSKTDGEDDGKEDAKDDLAEVWADLANVKASGYDLKSKDFKNIEDEVYTGEVQDNGSVEWTGYNANSKIFKYSKAFAQKFSDYGDKSEKKD